MKKFLLATVSMVALSAAARAADMPPAKGPIYSPAPVTTWDGLYVGIQGGGVRHDELLQGSGTFLDVSKDGSKTGGTVGAVLGYNWQQGRFVYGVEGDWNWIGNTKATNFTPRNFSSSSNINWLATIRARAGLAVDSTLFYVTGGVAFAHPNNRYDALLGTGGIFYTFVQDQTKVGWTIGAGVEHEFAPHWTARTEFRYVDLGKSNVAQTNCSFTFCSDYRGEFSNSLMMGLVGLNYKFGGGRAPDWPRARAYAPAPTWSGGYLGVQGGVAQHYASFDTLCSFSCVVVDHRKTGGTAGGLLGYNWQNGSFVYGVEGHWNWIGAKTSRLDTAFHGDPATDLTSSFEAKWLATLGGRAGLAVDSTLLYVTGGLAVGHVKNDIAFLSREASSTFFTQNQTKVGWTAGVGAEYMFSQHWTARAEFRYADLGKSHVTCDGCSGAIGDFSNTLKLGLVGLNYKF